MAINIPAGYEDDDESLSAINVTPLVDVTLVLLIVFMITVPVIVGSAHVKIDLPQTSSVDSETNLLPLEFALKRNPDGPPLLYLNGSQITEPEVRKTFTAKKFTNEQSVSLLADRGIVYDDVMKVVDMLKSVGLKKLSLETRHVDARWP
jgi:biopolymer transport protein ExbD